MTQQTPPPKTLEEIMKMINAVSEEIQNMDERETFKYFLRSANGALDGIKSVHKQLQMIVHVLRSKQSNPKLPVIESAVEELFLESLLFDKIVKDKTESIPTGEINDDVRMTLMENMVEVADVMHNAMGKAERALELTGAI